MENAREGRFMEALTRASRGVKGACAEDMRRLGVHVGQNFVLEELWKDDGLTLGELARRLEVEVPTVTRMTKRMEASGLLTRVPDARDRRVVRVRLTERGRSLRDVLPSMLEGVADRAMSGLTGAERDQLIMLLDRVAANMAARRPPPGAPAR